MSQQNNFDPSGVAEKNGNFLGLPARVDDAELVLFQVPWDVTTSYRPGTRNGPQAIIEASYQLDLFSPYKADVWKMKIGTLPLDEKWLKQSEASRLEAEKYIAFLEEGGTVEQSSEMERILKESNLVNESLHKWTYEETKALLKKGKKVFTIGGDHSISFGPIKAYSEKYSDLSILHFDAHADLREAYEGFEHSHASIMFNVLKQTDIKKLVQVGIRDVSEFEVNLIKNNSARVKTYFDWRLKEQLYSGRSWKEICEEIVEQLSQNVYISFDIDGLDPKLCPNTGTPVPGGLEFQEATYLIHQIRKSGRNLVGADLIEVAPAVDSDNQWDGNVGARLLFQMCIASG